MSMSLLTFNANLYARPAGFVAGEVLKLRGLQLPTLKSSKLQVVFDAYFSVTFEQTFEAMQRLPQMDAEPDGFFVFSGNSEAKDGTEDGPTRWQVDGHLFDFDDSLHRVQLSGSCPAQSYAALLACFGKCELVYELMREGVLLDEAAFQRYARAMPA